MSDTIPSPNMNMPVPVVGVDPGPDWANNINACLGILDQHNHSPGQGVQITPSGLNINSDLTMNSNNLTFVKTVRFSPLLTTLPGLPPNLGAIYVAGNELVYNDEIGNVVQITHNGVVNAGAGSITGLPSGTASVSYSAGSETYIFQSATSTPANIDGGSFVFRNITSGSHGVTVSAPAALGADYGLTLPTLPSVTSIMTLDPSGNMAADLTPDNVTIGIVGNELTVIQSAVGAPGTIVMFGGITPPAGYLLCDGSAVSRTTYANLFAAIGSQWGNGDQSTTFNLPMLNGLFARGADNGSGNDPDVSSRTALISGQSNPTGTWGSGVNVITGLSDTTNIAVGSQVISSFFPTGTYVTAITSSSSVTVSQNSTGGATGMIGFGNSASTIGVGSFQLDEIAAHAHPIAEGSTAGGTPNAASSGAFTSTGSTENFGGLQTMPRNVYVNYIIKT
jgi:microcystin-dependent protein